MLWMNSLGVDFSLVFPCGRFTGRGQKQEGESQLCPWNALKSSFYSALYLHFRHLPFPLLPTFLTFYNIMHFLKVISLGCSINILFSLVACCKRKTQYRRGYFVISWVYQKNLYSSPSSNFSVSCLILSLLDFCCLEQKWHCDHDHILRNGNTKNKTD